MSPASHKYFARLCILTFTILIPALSQLQLVSPAIAISRAPVKVKSGERIPINADSWSLFLVCDPSWLEQTANSHRQLSQLYSTFLGFGNAIGSRNYAVWFVKGTAQKGSDPALNYDAIRAADYCAEYKLSSRDSPHVVVTTQYPRPVGAPGDFCAISLHGLDSKQANILLGQLADMVRARKINHDQIGSDQYWRHWAQVLDTAVTQAHRLTPAIHAELNAGLMKVTFSGEKLSK
jgi:hypothetical protein